MVAAGANVIYTVVVTNNGPNQSQNVVFYENIPANTTFQSIGTVPTGWTCTTPAVNGTTPINCSIASLANAGTATFTVTLQVTRWDRGGNCHSKRDQRHFEHHQRSRRFQQHFHDHHCWWASPAMRTCDSRLPLLPIRFSFPVRWSTTSRCKIWASPTPPAPPSPTRCRSASAFVSATASSGQLLAKRRRGYLQSRNSQCRCHCHRDDQCDRARYFQLSQRHGQHDVRGNRSVSLQQFRDAAYFRAAAFLRYALRAMEPPAHSRAM